MATARRATAGTSKKKSTTTNARPTKATAARSKAAAPTVKASTRKPDSIALPDEKRIKPTGKDLPLKAPAKLSRAARAPVPEPAVDHRRQVLDDEPRKAGGHRPRGGGGSPRGGPTAGVKI